MTDCPICCTTYNKSTAKCITCPRHDCGQSACKSCVATYLLGSNSDPHCMHCRVAWDHNFLAKNLTMKFLKNDYAKHRQAVLFEREQARIPDTQNEVIQYRQLQDLRKQNKDLGDEMRQLRERLRTLEEEYNTRTNLIIRIETGAEKIKVEQRAFVMPCPETDCKGYLSTAYKCASCSKFACPHCLVVLGEEKDPNHECDPDVVATIEQIKKETKGCPKCGERIGKVSGCDQMWCPKCQTAFSWRTGKIESGTIHNPHYFQWARQNAAGGVIPRQPGDIGPRGPCGQAIPWRAYGTFANHVNLVYFYDAIATANRYSNHLNGVTIPTNEREIERCNNHTRLRVQYIVGECAEDDFKYILQNHDMKRKKLTDLNNIYQLFSHAAGDIVNNFIAKMTEGLARDQYGNHIFPRVKSSEATNQNYLRRGQYFITAVDELDALVSYTNNELAKYSSTYGGSVQLITLENYNGHDRGEKFSKLGSDNFVKGNTMNAEDERAYYKRQYDKFMENPLKYVREQREHPVSP